MQRASGLVVALLLSACGGGGEATGSGETPTSATSAGGPIYDLHEWGVVAVRPGGFEVAAGAGRPSAVQLNVDKPVLYVHSDEPAAFPLSVQVTVPDTLRTVEHFPPTNFQPLRWQAQVGTAGCRGSYPSGSDGIDARCVDGYCEIYELGRYETRDARCLTVGPVSAPLLFYRLWAPSAAPALPLGVALEGDEALVTRLTSGGTRGSVIRIQRHGSSVLTRVTPLADGQRALRIPAPTATASVGLAALRAALAEQGLTADEAAAFLNGWQESLFGTWVGSADAPAGDRPVDVDVDVLTVDDEVADGDRMAAPRDEDVLLYWLTPEAIDTFARIEASPPPRHLRRVFMVRQVLR